MNDLCPPVARLAELVEHLCACSTAVAHDTVRRVADPAAPATADEALAVVARAMVRVRHDPDGGRLRPGTR